MTAQAGLQVADLKLHSRVPGGFESFSFSGPRQTNPVSLPIVETSIVVQWRIWRRVTGKPIEFLGVFTVP